MMPKGRRVNILDLVGSRGGGSSKAIITAEKHLPVKFPKKNKKEGRDNMIITGDCLEIMPTFEADSIDSIVTDPPYGLSFMGKNWDHGIPGAPFWVEALRVAKPGAFLLAFGGTRTFHRLAVAIEDAGWELRDTIGWLYGSGFPKSLNIGKAVDKLQGSERKTIREYKTHDIRNAGLMDKKGSMSVMETKGSSEWEGWGTALKPAWEPIIVARKPIEKTVAENVLKYGTGGINIDGCRVEYQGDNDKLSAIPQGRCTNKVGALAGGTQNDSERTEFERPEQKGRFPANLIHDGSDEVLAVFPESKSGAMLKPYKYTNNGFSLGAPAGSTKQIHEASSGSAARFFYCAKASKQDRDEGCEGLDEKTRKAYSGAVTSDPRMTHEQQRLPSRNNHPTVKPTTLMRYLCRLVTPPNGLILDPFCGSGSTGKAAIMEGFRFIGTDKEPEYVEIARRRIEAEKKQIKMF